MVSTPYLQLRDRLSQIWINKYTLLLVILALKIILFHNSLNHSIKTVRDYTLDSCPTIDSFASTAVSLPHYLSKASNYIIIETLEELNTQTQNGLRLILTGSENIIIFAIDMMIGTYACLLVSAIDGAVDVAVNGTESIIEWVNDTLGEITDGIEDGLTDISDFINEAIEAVDTVKDFFTGDDSNNATESITKVNLTISSLKNLNIPSSINDKLEYLKNNTPSFDEVENETERLVREPFEILKDKVSNTTFIDQDDSDLLYVAPITQSTICSGNTDTIKDFYDELSKDISISLKVIVVLLFLAALSALIPLAYQEYRTWGKLTALRENIRKDTGLPDYDSKSIGYNDPIDSHELAFNHYPSKVGILLSSKMTKPENIEGRTTIRWIAAYVLSSRSLIILGFALIGILAVVFQFIILTVLTKSINNNKSPFDSVTNELSDQIGYSVSNWTDSTNSYLNDKEISINDDLFSWVKTACDSVNDTISTFVNGMNDAITDAFNGTILYEPVKTVVGCVIERKLVKVEEGLTWIYDHAEIVLPRVNETYIYEGLGSSDDNNGTDGLISKASYMVDSLETAMESLLRKTISQYKESLMTELYISLTCFGIWFIQIFIALIMCWIDGKFVSSNSEPRQANQSDITLNEIKPKNISYPRQLTNEEKESYGYPFTAPIAALRNGKDLFKGLTGNSKPNTDSPFDDSQHVDNKESFGGHYQNKNPFDDRI